MSYIRLDVSNLTHFVNKYELDEMQSMVNAVDSDLRNGTGAGNNFLGWLDLPLNYDKEEMRRVKNAAQKIQSDSDILLVLGIGGSYLGAHAAIDFLNNNFYNMIEYKHRSFPKILFAGNSLSSSYIYDLLNLIGDHDFSINIISKSGTTLEPSIAFRIFKAKLEEKYGYAGARKRIYATTDKKNGALKNLADNEGYEEFTIPDNVGGRFSVLTPVGLLPIAVSGVNIDKLMQGASDARLSYMNPDLNENEAYKYATLRNILFRKGYNIELLENYEPSLISFMEWWKQLMAESEGKDNKGIFPSCANFTTDLHSLGQYIQEGQRLLMETVISIDNVKHDIDIPLDKDNLDGLNYLVGKTVNYANKKACQGVTLAHVDGGVPNMIINIPNQTEYTLGYLIYFFEIAVSISGYLNGVNPFNQPGVEEYKNNMFSLLDRPGYKNLINKLENNNMF